MPWSVEDVERDMSLLVLVLLLLSLLLKSEGRVGWSGFIWWNDESSEDEAFPDFMVEGEGD